MIQSFSIGYDLCSGFLLWPERSLVCKTGIPYSWYTFCLQLNVLYFQETMAMDEIFWHWLEKVLCTLCSDWLPDLSGKVMVVKGWLCLQYHQLKMVNCSWAVCHPPECRTMNSWPVFDVDNFVFVYRWKELALTMLIYPHPSNFIADILHFTIF